MSSLAVNAITDASGGTTASINGYTPTASNMAGKNRIINGDMRIDQRNAGASVTPANGEYTVDRWIYGSTQASKFTAQQTTTAPTGFNYSLKLTVSSAVSIGAGDIFGIDQRIEGYNVADLGWGTANAQAITLSFWVRSSLTGTFGGSIINGTFNSSYPFTYSISAADTWEQKTITIAGDTSGTWATTNGLGIRVLFSLGSGATYSGTAGAWSGSGLTSATGATSVVGTSGATFYITGVQLEAGSVATSFERRMYGQELALCQRYTRRMTLNNYVGYRDSSAGTGGLQIGVTYNPMRTAPSFTRITDNITLSAGALASDSARLITSTSFSAGTVKEINADFILSAEL